MDSARRISETATMRDPPAFVTSCRLFELMPPIQKKGIGEFSLLTSWMRLRPTAW